MFSLKERGEIPAKLFIVMLIAADSSLLKLETPEGFGEANVWG
jgi:hypothetical protein